MYPRKVRLRRTGRRAAAGRQRELRHQARPEKTDGTTTACGGHWYTTPAQVKTEKTARHLQSKKVKFLHFFTLIFRADLVIMVIK
ncbi:hypothetical protein Q9Y94_004136 [Salmonella enterica subsp. enterica serovar Cerro]|nr:hypothetical protein [Escherichia coli]EIA0896506.1 hypothetical protein [Shigella sonnei]EIK1861972.1 hypothetical protein [Salmonella enterica]ELH5241500.1 hypothetical protein [Salmonella enterica subsp. enterica serovar Typhimurium]ELH5255164.1 hypothetical protein [Salmonella enterica subsp. enterica serovar Cerro]